MRGTVILCHGSDSGPEATKVSALAKVAEALGWHSRRLDFRADDQRGYAAAVPLRVAKITAAMREASHPVVLAGSSMGAFTCGLASLQAPCDGVFLVALPTMIPGGPQAFDMARDVSAMLVHGYEDSLCPVLAAQAFARSRGIPALLLPGDHRLADQLPAIERAFSDFLAVAVA
ncbi:MAG TPA: alpha/beta family hydrolase [Rhodanobacteraceae bacterium]|nr:alpha/beta family hydrolase [Rhodanobacteraceae bacterium]